MELDNYQLVRVTWRVREAMGYLGLGMVDHALDCLDAAERVGDLGAFKLVVDMCRAEILHRPDSYDEAAKALEELAEKLPPAYGHSLWLALSMCYRHAGDEDRAINSLAYARGAKPASTKADD